MIQNKKSPSFFLAKVKKFGTDASQDASENSI